MRDATDLYRQNLSSRDSLGEAFAEQILGTVKPRLNGNGFASLNVLDIGCGTGRTAKALALHCARVVGVEADETQFAAASAVACGIENLEIVQADITRWSSPEKFDLVVLDNVYEHVSNHELLLEFLLEALKPGGAFYILVPNKLWPIEAHYRLPFLSYLPLPLANVYLQLSKRGTDYRDCSYTPTWWSLQRDLARVGGLDYEFALPKDLALAQNGANPLYKIGYELIRICPTMWAISKALLIIGNRTY